MAHEAPQSRNEALLQNALGESNPVGEPQSRIEALLQELVAELTAVQADSVAYLTEAPTSANTDGLKFVVLSSDPATKYDGYIYIITGGQNDA